MMWASHMGTLMAQTFKVVYSHTCHCMCWRGRHKISESLKKEVQEAKREVTQEPGEETEGSQTPRRHAIRMPMEVRRSRRDAFSLGSSAHGLYPTSEQPSRSHSPSPQSQRQVEQEVNDLLVTCAKYNMTEGIADPNLEPAIIDEIRQASIINDRSLQPSPLSLPKLTPVTRPKNPHVFVSREPSPDILRVSSELIHTMQQSPITSRNNNRAQASPSFLMPPPQPVRLPSRNPSPVSSTRTRETRTAMAEDGPPPIERVPPLPVLCFLLIYLTLGAVIFKMWSGQERWSFLEGFYFCFITLTTIGLGDYVPGAGIGLGEDASNNDDSYKLICSVVYLLVGLCFNLMCFNLIQEEAVEYFINKGRQCGLIGDDEDDDDTI